MFAKEIFVAIENIRSLHNIGAIIRTCEFFGVNKIALVGYTAYDPYSPNQIKPEITKTALSALNHIKLMRFENITEMRKDYLNHEIICVENNVSNTTPITDFKLQNNAILIFGNETTGIEAGTLKIADKILEIPRIGHHASLNVSAAAGVTLFSLKNIKS